jgi:hypothetical protein
LRRQASAPVGAWHGAPLTMNVLLELRLIKIKENGSKGKNQAAEYSRVLAWQWAI